MENRIKVIGKSQNGVALGVMKAYVTMYPGTTLDDLRKVFPNELAPDKGVKEIFLPCKEAEAVNLQSNTSLYFVKDQRPILLSNRQRVAVSQIWTSKSFSNLIEVAAKLGIAVELDKDTDKDVKETGYVLEYLNGWKPATPKKGCLGMAALLVIAGGCTLFGLMELIYCLTK